MNFLLALVGAVLYGVLFAGLTNETQGVYLTFVEAVQYFVLINIFLAMFNLLPIPPFDGSHIVEGLLPPSLARKYRALRPYGMLAFFGIVALSWFAPGLGVIENVIIPPVLWVMEQYMAVSALVAGAT